MERRDALPGAALDGEERFDRIRMAPGRNRPSAKILPPAPAGSEGAKDRKRTMDGSSQLACKTMENPTHFDLNEAIRRWHKNLGASLAFKADNLEELESHLRASVQRLQSNGLSEEEAFLIAMHRIGERGLLEREYAKVNSSRARVGLLGGLAAVLMALLLMQYLWSALPRWDKGHFSVGRAGPAARVPASQGLHFKDTQLSDTVRESAVWLTISKKTWYLDVVYPGEA